MRPLSCGERAILGQDGPEDEPAPEFERVRSIKAARKPHACGHCRHGLIPAGHPYVEHVTIEGGEFARRTYCAGPRGWNCTLRLPTPA